MIWRIEILHKPGVFDAAGASTLKDIQDLGINTVDKVLVMPVYLIEGDIAFKEVHRIAKELLVDPVVEKYSVSEKPTKRSSNKDRHIIEITYNRGVMDPVEQSTLKAIKDLGIDGVTSVGTAKEFSIEGKLSKSQLNLIQEKVLMNKLIQHAVTDPKESFESLAMPSSPSNKVEVVVLDLIDASDKKLKQISEEGQLFLNLDEMKTIQKHFASIKRNPTDCELETIAQTWSEHCHHKTFRGNIEFHDKEKGTTKKIKNLIKNTIFKTTNDLKKSWCVSVFHDNAGVVKFDHEYNVCFKVETHNHPSALEPFGGANTGLGGVIRDTLGTGLGAKPICNTDIFCFANPDTKYEELPPGTLHPRRVMKGVVAGVRDYGNKMGIPTVNGSIIFDNKFIGNPLVFCGNVGLIPKGKEKKQPKPGDLVVVAGGRTGRDGIHGATFSSGELTTESETVSSGAVQIGNPIEEKKVTDVLLQARDANLYTAITDCGAGGLSSAVGEMGEQIGARVDLEKVPLKYQGLKYMEIWISESQERMVFSVPKKNIDKFLKIFEKENVEAVVIGEFTKTKRLELFYHGHQVCDLSMQFLHDGIPKIVKKAVWSKPKHKLAKIKPEEDLTGKLKEALAHLNVCSKESVVRQYDHEVQAGSIVKPFVGLHNDGPSDAAVVQPRWGSNKGVVVSNGINIRYGMIDPYHMAASCIDEAIRNVIAVGGRFDRIALLDNFCWGNPDKPDRLGGLVRTSYGCYETALKFGTPFISGKDSLYNEYTEGKKSIAIPGTILISALSLIDNVQKAVTMDLKEAGNLIYIVGKTYDELGGSIYLDTHGLVGQNVPQVRINDAIKTFKAMEKAIRKGLVRSAHDCSEGGIATAISEMAFAGGLGATAVLSKVPFKGEDKRSDTVMFSESNSRFLVEVEPQHQKAFEKIFKGLSSAMIGQVEISPEVMINGVDGRIAACASIEDLKAAWQSTLQL